ncbi:Gfo/Idh/MocA family protein [Streptomyces sp. 4N509B]|uniref:Gfo/Idh/MocA family protein n=1 Tax=Streptomyces sp. 4N509B TaxID=3457413 RepID=UPI003FD1D0F5
MAATPLRIGLLGCAEIALRRMLPAIDAHPELRVEVVASRDAARAKEVAARFGCRPATGYEGVLAEEDVDAVYVPVPAALHAPWVEAALEAGKHVLAEKPLTLDAGRTRALCALARRRGLALVENVMFVHHAQHRAVLDQLAAGAVGTLRSFHATFTIPSPPAEDIRFRRALGGGALTDVGVYPLRAALHLLGPELTVDAARLVTGAGREVDTWGAALLGRPDGVTAQLTWGMDNAYDATYELRGTEGRITVSRAYTPPADLRPQVRVTRGGQTEELALAPDDQVHNTLTAFARAAASAAAPDPAVERQAELLDAVRSWTDASSAIE